MYVLNALKPLLYTLEIWEEHCDPLLTNGITYLRNSPLAHSQDIVLWDYQCIFTRHYNEPSDFLSYSFFKLAL